jgi:hypothetical protein
VIFVTPLLNSEVRAYNTNMAKPPYVADPAKREEMLAEMEARPELSLQQLLELFPSDFIQKVDERHRELVDKPVSALLGFVMLEGANAEERRLFDYAQRNVGYYEDDVEDALYEDPILTRLIEVRGDYSGSAEFTQAMRLRRTVVAHYLVTTDYLAKMPGDETPEQKAV